MAVPCGGAHAAATRTGFGLAGGEVEEDILQGLVAVLVEDGTPVQFGDDLFSVK